MSGVVWFFHTKIDIHDTGQVRNHVLKFKGLKNWTKFLDLFLSWWSENQHFFWFSEEDNSGYDWE